MPRLAFIIACLAFGSTHLLAAEIRLREKCRPAAVLVRLGDVAEVLSADVSEAQRLGAVELCAAPALGGEKLLRSREVQDILALRGVRLGEHRFSGASQVLLLGAEPAREVPPQAERPQPVRSVNMRKSEGVVRELLQGYLQRMTGGAELRLEFELTEAAAQVAAAGEAQVAGGKSPWLGQQTFHLISPEGRTAEVAARVTMPAQILVAIRPLSRGEFVHAADVQLHSEPADRHGLNRNRPGYVEPYRTLEEVVGLEVTRSIAAGETLDPRSLQRPILVRRGEVVTVYARTPGVRVRTTGRAREEGSQGDLVTVESLTDRTKFYARVSGPQEVELFPRAVDPQAAAR